MERVWDLIKRRRNEIAEHPFFVWLNSDAIALEQRFVFAPVMIDFIMGFADMNKWFLSYPDAKNDYERAINEHTEEDRTHSRLFYENWYTLELGDPGRWAPGKVLWWLFHSQDCAIVRRFGMDILDLSVTHPGPLERFALMEAIEVCGDVFFGNTAAIAERLSERDQIGHIYFGQYHRDRETGHLHTNEAMFTSRQLSWEQSRQAAHAVTRVFDLFLCVLDQLLSYGQRALAKDGGLARELDDEYELALSSGGAASSPRWTAPQLAGRRVSPSQFPAVRLLEKRLERLRSHPLLRWLREDDTAPSDKLRSFVALWGVDIVGYKDFNELVLRYPTPHGSLELAINRWTEDLATHGVLYLQDWRALTMDQRLRWDAGETMAFYFLGAQTEVHRRNMAKVKRYAFGHKQPAVRWWLMKALESSGEPLFACTAPVAEAAEREEGLVLNYWANRHDFAHQLPGSGSNDGLFLSEPISPHECEVVCQMIDTVFDSMEEQYALSYAAATSRVFVHAPATLPPPAPRVSEVVGLAPSRASTTRLAG